MICSTLSGMMSIKHPTLGVLVREDGMVFNRVRSGNHNKYAWTKGWEDRYGYRQVSINNKSYDVHRLVAEAFIPNQEKKPTVDHINRIRDDNRVQNLRWATYKEQAENTEKVILSRMDGHSKSDYSKRYHKSHRDEILHRQHEYYKANRDELLARKRAYDIKHREERRESARKRRERKKQEKLAAAKESQ